MLSSLYKLLPESLRRLRRDLSLNLVSLYWIVSNALFDTARYAKFSRSLRKSRSRANEAALITFYYHKIEKGLSLPRPKLGFGASWITPAFLPLLRSYLSRYGQDEVTATSQRALESYVLFHTAADIELSGTAQEVKAYLSSIPGPVPDVAGGVLEIRADLLKPRWTVDFADFAAARHSVRVFSEKHVDREDVQRAVVIAQRAPSVCNRQSWRVYALTNRDSIKKALSFQNGNAGFGDRIPCLLLVTGDTSAMIFTYERNQIWIDGGLFSMALVYALQSLGLATCCLNLCVPWPVEKQLAGFYRLPGCERPIMMIAVGHLPDRLLVANSQRKPVDSVLTWADTSASSPNSAL